MKVGDKVTTLISTYGTGSVDGDTIYTILEIGEDWVKLKHPEIGGYFVFKRESIGRVICK